MAKRFYQIAFELGLRPRTFIRALSDRGLSVGNQMVVVPESLEERIRALHADIGAAPQEAQQPVGAGVVGEPFTDAMGEGRPAPGTLVRDVQAPAPPTQEQAPVADTAAADADDPGQAAPQESQPEPAVAPQPSGRVIDDSARPRQGELVPAIDPRAGGLVKDAPAGGVPGLRPQDRGGSRGGPPMPGRSNAPGAVRDGSTRRKDRFSHKRGKETFSFGRGRFGRGRRGPKRPAAPKIRPTDIEVSLPITVKGFAELSTYKAAELIKVLFKNHSMMLTPNSVLDQDTCELLGLELDINVTFKEQRTAESELLRAIGEIEDQPEDLKPRPPIVTILGHVDHGKTTLLDKIRSTDIAGKEAGGITQHIGASQVTLEDGRRVTFIDTPGHEAFTEMRARGAQVTDVVVLVCAADDGVMPQTIEAINHAKAADVTIVIAVTKIDKEGAKVERIKQQLAEHEIYVEGYGGDVSLFGVSGITGEGVSELLEHLALLADVDEEKFRANPSRAAMGTVIEGRNHPQRGRLATILVQNGTLQKGDPIVVGGAWGTVRSMFNDMGKPVKSAGPGDPVEITGLDKTPEAGSRMFETESASQAKEIATARRQKAREAEMAARTKPATLETLFQDIEERKIEAVNLVVKADVSGSLAPLRRVLERMGTDEVRPNIIHSAVGAVSESDVVLASASNAVIIAFHANTDAKARQRAKRDHVEIRPYKIIYDIEADVREMLEGRLAPELEEKVLGHAEILAIFTFSKIGNIAGCRVRDGVIRRDARVRVFRGEELRHEGVLLALRREKEDAKEVKEGFECGITVRDFDDFDVGDTIEAYIIEAKKRTL